MLLQQAEVHIRVHTWLRYTNDKCCVQQCQKYFKTCDLERVLKSIYPSAKVKYAYTCLHL